MLRNYPPTGGSLRIYAGHSEDKSKQFSSHVDRLRAIEEAEGFTSLAKYTSFAEKVNKTKRNILDLLVKIKRERKTIVGYGAPGKGNTLLNYCGIRSDFLDYTVDRNPYKHGKFLPGTEIPIFAPNKIKETRPDYVFILPWNIKEEIMEQTAYIGEWEGRFIIPIPEVTIYNADGVPQSTEKLQEDTHFEISIRSEIPQALHLSNP